MLMEKFEEGSKLHLKELRIKENAFHNYPEKPMYKDKNIIDKANFTRSLAADMKEI